MTRSEENPRGSNDPETGDYLSRAEVCRLFGVSPSTVTRWARLGLIKAFRTPGGHYRYPAAETRRAAGQTAAAGLTRLD